MKVDGTRTTALDGLRSRAFGTLRSSFGNLIPPIRWTKDILLFVNEMAGKPLAPAEELADRREKDRVRRQQVSEARARRLEELRARREEKAPPKAKREAAPVTIYTDDNSRRELERIRGVLKGRDIPFKELDVEHDEASKSWVRTRAGAHDLPVVFIADEPVGAYNELVQLDVTGELSRRVYGP
jgi:glutaredoxin